MSRSAVPRGGAVLPVDKPVGPTSHDVVSRARKALGVRRIGHTGTLDPFASGLLLLCVGPATRLAEYLTGMDKEYEATVRLGTATETDDPEGAVVATDEAWRGLDRDALDRAVAGFLGVSEQRPPAYSAKKRGGEAAYRKARRGEAVELDPVEVHVRDVQVLSADLPDVRIRLRCSSGTYVRALARDLGEALGTAAHCASLRRTAVGGFAVGDALTVEALDDAEAVSTAWIDPVRALGHLAAVEVEAAEARRLAHGQAVDRPEEGGTAPGADAPTVAVVRKGALLAVAEREGGRLRPRKVFVRPEDLP